jgi:hypothetical protein
MKDTFWNPTTGLRMFGVLIGEESAAEPVPVRRPGVCVTGVEAREDGADNSTASQTGSTKVGLNLDGNVRVVSKRKIIQDAPKRQPQNFYP